MLPQHDNFSTTGFSKRTQYIIFFFSTGCQPISVGSALQRLRLRPGLFFPLHDSRYQLDNPVVIFSCLRVFRFWIFSFESFHYALYFLFFSGVFISYTTRSRLPYIFLYAVILSFHHQYYFYCTRSSFKREYHYRFYHALMYLYFLFSSAICLIISPMMAISMDGVPLCLFCGVLQNFPSKPHVKNSYFS